MEQLNITTGNTVNLHLTLTRLNEPFPLEWATDVVVNLLSTLGTRTALSPVINDDGTVDVTVPAVEKPGNYGIEVRGILNGNPWRTYTGGILRYTYATVPGASEATLQGDVYDITMVVQMNAPAAPSTQVQSDWAETDSSLPAFIKNKPTIPDAQVQSDWAETDDTLPAFIKHKPVIPGFVEWRGHLNDDGVRYTIPGHTLDELWELLSQGKLIVLHFDIEESMQTFVGWNGQSFHRVYTQLGFLPGMWGLFIDTLAFESEDNGNINFTFNRSDNLAHIPLYLSDLGEDESHRTVSDTEKSSWNGKYAKPTGGIPATDLAAAVQAALGKAASALQAETDPTVPAWAKAPQKPAYTAEEVGALPATTPIPTVPKNVSAFANDAGYLTQHQDISGKEDKMAIATPAGTAIAAVAGTYYRFAAAVDTLAVTLPTMADVSKVATVVLYLTTGTAPAVTFASSHPVVYQDGFALEASKTYEINCLFNGAAWVLMAAEINTGS